MVKKLKITDSTNSIDMDYDEHYTRECIGFRTLSNSFLFKNILSFIDNFLAESNFVVNSEGIYIKSMDSNHISFIDCFIPGSLFSLYNCPAEIVCGFDLKTLNKILSHLSFDDELILIFKEDYTEIKYINSKYTKYYKIKNMSIETDGIEVQDLVEMTHIDLDSKYFHSLINNFVDIGDNLRIKLLKEKNKISIKSQGDMTDLKIVLNNDDLEIKNIQDICLEFNIKNILSFSKGYNLSEKIKLKMGPDVPIQLSYLFQNNGYLHYYIAPKISDT